MSISDTLISFETAKLAKEKGIKLQLFGEGYEYTDKDGNEFWTSVKNGASGKEKTTPVIKCTQSLLQKWLREKYNIDIDVCRDIEVHYNDETRWIVKVSNFNNIIEKNTPIAVLKHPEHYHYIDFKSYEEALEKGLYQALLLI